MEDYDQLKLFVDEKFPKWQNRLMPCTYVAPPIFIYDNKQYSSSGASNYICTDKRDHHAYEKLEADLVEEHVLNVFLRFGDYSNQPMFIFPDFKYENLLTIIMNGQSHVTPRKNTDLLIVHRQYGIILVEVKLNPNKYKEAKKQLDETEKLLYHDTHLSKYFQLNKFCQNSSLVVMKVFACPCNDSDIKGKQPGYINLCKNHMDCYEAFSQWWQVNIADHSFVKWWLCKVKLYESVYNNLVPILLCKRDSMHWNMSTGEIRGWLEKQKILDLDAKRQSKKEKDGNKLKQTENIPGLGKQSALHKLWKYVTLEQLEVWNGERQIIFGPYGSGKTVLIQCKAADLAACFGGSVLIILPTDHLVENYEVYFSKLNSWETSKNYTRDKKIKDIILSHNSGGKITLVPLVVCCDDWQTYKPLITNSHVFLDELLWLPIEPSLSKISKNLVEMFDVVFNQITKQTEYHVWIAPHLYFFLTRLLAKSIELDDNAVNYFLKFATDYQHVKTVHTTFRMTKQIHDFMIQKEWKDFCQYTDDENLVKLFSNDKSQLEFESNYYKRFLDIFQTVLCNYRGHHVTGPPVRIFNFECHSHIRSRYDEDTFRRFVKFSASVIASEVDRHLSNRKSKFKPKDIAVIIDTCTTNHVRLRSELTPDAEYQNANTKHWIMDELNSDMYGSLNDPRYKDGRIVAICNSDDIASFEWPVVIHVKYLYDFNYGLQTKGYLGYLTYFESYHHMIASRCTFQYTIIDATRSGKDDYIWPHNKSFQEFKLWCEEEMKDFNRKAFLEYSEL